MTSPYLNSLPALQQDPGLAVRAGRHLRRYHYERMGLDAPEHGKGHFHYPRRNSIAAKEAKRAATLEAEPGLPSSLSPGTAVTSGPLYSQCAMSLHSPQKIDRGVRLSRTVIALVCRVDCGGGDGVWD